MQLTTVQLVSIVITLVLTILPGIYAGRKIKSADDYALGGRSAGIGMVAGSIIGTIVGGAATIGTAQLGFQLGLTAWWFTLGSGIGFIIMGLFYARPLRNSGLMTIFSCKLREESWSDSEFIGYGRYIFQYCCKHAYVNTFNSGPFSCKPGGCCVNNNCYCCGTGFFWRYQQFWNGWYF